MTKKIMVFHGRESNGLLLDLFDALKEREISLRFLTDCPNLREQASSRNWPAASLPALCREKPCRGWLSSKFVRALLPLRYLALKRAKKQFGLEAVLFISWPEKLLYTPLATALKLKTVWLECPPLDFSALPAWAKAKYRRHARHADIIVFSEADKDELCAAGIEAGSIRVVVPGLARSSWEHQATIFSKIAQTEHERQNRKYFTVGTIAGPNSQQRIEVLFHAATKCLTVIPNLQIIVVGDGEGKKNLEWLAKKLGVGAIVWFVGEAANPNKWIGNFDLFVATASPLDLDGMRSALRAVALGLPVIGQAGSNLEGIVRPDHNGITVETGASDPLAQAIIELFQNRRLRDRFRQNAKEMAKKELTIDRMADDIAMIIK